jgi:DNA replication protein DnaC
MAERQIAGFVGKPQTVRQYAEAEEPEHDSPTVYIDQQIGKRYVRCRLDTFRCDGENAAAKQKAVDQCREYVNQFADHYEAGRSLVVIGPKGTGKDHLVSAVVREIARRLGKPGAVIFRDGLTLYSEFKSAFDQVGSQDAIVAKYVAPKLFAVSDPVPPSGPLSNYDQQIILRIIDGRYRECRPIAVTVNCATRAEMATRMGAQATDRLFDCAIVVPCNWPTFRESYKDVH